MNWGQELLLFSYKYFIEERIKMKNNNLKNYCCPFITFNFCLVSSEMLPFGERRVGVGGVTVISGGNLVTDEGMKSFGMLGRMRVFTRVPSVLFCWLPKVCELELSSGLELEAKQKIVRKNMLGSYLGFQMSKKREQFIVKTYGWLKRPFFKPCFNQGSETEERASRFSNDNWKPVII